MKFKQKRVRNKLGVEFELRSPRPDEAQLMLEHMRITARESYRNLNQTPAFWDAMTVEKEREILNDVEASSDRAILCAFRDGRIIGGLGFFGVGGEFTAHSGRVGMSVQAAYCGAGLGEILLREALGFAKEAGFHRVELTVRTSNPGAIALYEKVGFERVGRLSHVARVDGEYVDEFLYQLLI